MSCGIKLNYDGGSDDGPRGGRRSGRQRVRLALRTLAPLTLIPSRASGAHIAMRAPLTVISRVPAWRAGRDRQGPFSRTSFWRRLYLPYNSAHAARSVHGDMSCSIYIPEGHCFVCHRCSTVCSSKAVQKEAKTLIGTRKISRGFFFGRAHRYFSSDFSESRSNNCFP